MSEVQVRFPEDGQQDQQQKDTYYDDWRQLHSKQKYQRTSYDYSLQHKYAVPLPPHLFLKPILLLS